MKNVGDAPARDVKLVATQPNGMEFVSTNNLGAYKESERAVYWDLAELPVGAEGTVELVLSPAELAKSQLTFVAEGPRDLTAQAALDVAVVGMSALSFNVKTSNVPIEVGGEIEYVVQLVNRGTSQSNNVKLRLDVPAAMEITSAEGPTRLANSGSALEFSPLSSIPPKSAVEYVIKANAKDAGDWRVAFQISSDDLEPLVKEESVRVYR